MITVPVELFSKLSNPVKTRWNAEFIGYTNGYSLYMADENAFDQQFYEAMSSPFEKGAGEQLIQEIGDWLEEKGYTYPTVMDETGEIFAQYGISAFPTTFMIDKEGNIFGYVESALTGDVMESIVQQTMSGKRTS